jgi:hypothetical protein
MAATPTLELVNDFVLKFKKRVVEFWAVGELARSLNQKSKGRASEAKSDFDGGWPGSHNSCSNNCIAFFCNT